MLRLMIKLGMRGKSHKAREEALLAWMDKNGIGC